MGLIEVQRPVFAADQYENSSLVPVRNSAR